MIPDQTTITIESSLSPVELERLARLYACGCTPAEILLAGIEAKEKEVYI